MRLMTFEEEGKKVVEVPIPADLEIVGQFARQEMLEALYTLAMK